MHKGTVQPDGELLRRMRIEQGLTQEDVARLAGYDKKTIQNAEASKPQRAATLAAICGALKIEIRDVVRREPKESAAGTADARSRDEWDAAAPAKSNIERMSIKLWIGQTHGTKKVFYSKQQIKEILRNSAIGWTLVAGEGAEGGSTEWEEMGILEHLWKRDGQKRFELEQVFEELNGRLRQIFADMDQRWVQLDFTAVLSDHRVLTDQKEVGQQNLPLKIEDLFQGNLRIDNRQAGQATVTVSTEAGPALNTPADAFAGCIQSFDAFIAERTRDFFPRAYAIEEIDRFMRREPSGYFFISGHPGMGKSAMMAHLVRTRQYIHHFNIAAESRNTSEQFLKNICAQLILRFKLPYSSIPEDADKGGQVLLDLLEQSSRLLAGDERLVIVIDAIDEVDWRSVSLCNVLYLPTSLPEHVYMVVSTRPLAPLDPRSHLTVAPLHQLILDKDAKWNRDEVTGYLELKSSEEGIKKWIGARGLTRDGFVDLLLAKSETNFMYLRHVLPALAYERSDEKLITVKMRLEELPQGLLGYYRSHWAQMQVEDREKFDLLYRPVLCVLAAATELVPLSYLGKWSGVSPDQVRVVLDAWAEFIHSERDAEGHRVHRIYHNSFREFLEAEVDIGLEQSKRKIARSGLRTYGKGN